MRKNFIPLLFGVSALAVFGTPAAVASDAYFALAPGAVIGCPACTVTDTTGLVASATGQLYPNGWTVSTTLAGHLQVSNGIGADFTLPGHTFDLQGFTLAGRSNRTSGPATLSYTVYGYHPDPAAPVEMTVISVASRASPVFKAVDSRFTNLESVSVRYAPDIGVNYFVDVRFTSH